MILSISYELIQTLNELDNMNKIEIVKVIRWTKVSQHIIFPSAIIVKKMIIFSFFIPCHFIFDEIKQYVR